MPVEWLDPAHWVIDIIYFPLETEFLKAARTKGCTTINGAGMAVWQAVRAFEHFTGKDPDPKEMRAPSSASGLIPLFIAWPVDAQSQRSEVRGGTDERIQASSRAGIRWAHRPV